MSPAPGYVEQLEEELVAEGYVRGSPAYESMLRKRKVELCRLMRGVSCESCAAYLDCSLLKHYLRDLHYGVEVRDGAPGGRGTSDRGGSGPSG